MIMTPAAITDYLKRCVYDEACHLPAGDGIADNLLSLEALLRRDGLAVLKGRSGGERWNYCWNTKSLLL